jgi:hypothetical protein
MGKKQKTIMMINANSTQKYSLLLLILIILLVYNCGDSKSKSDIVSASNFPQPPTLNGQQFDTDSMINEFVLSANSWDTTKLLPDFILDSCLDANTIYWKSLHHPVSARYKVISAINNMMLIDFVIKNKLGEKLCNSNDLNIEIPYATYSSYDLFVMRKQEIMSSNASN